MADVIVDIKTQVVAQKPVDSFLNIKVEKVVGATTISNATGEYIPIAHFLLFVHFLYWFLKVYTRN